MAIGELAGCVLVSGLASLAMLALRLRAPLGADEGYLWFGVQQLLKGRLPHRDFRSYEPGRYLWSALWARLFGGGLRVLRARRTSGWTPAIPAGHCRTGVPTAPTRGSAPARRSGSRGAAGGP